MRVFVTSLATLLAIGGAAAAEPPNAARPKPAHSTQPPPAEIVLASAEVPHVPASDKAQPAQSPTKPRIAPRVTTCRCGDQQVDPETQEQ